MPELWAATLTLEQVETVASQPWHSDASLNALAWVVIEAVAINRLPGSEPQRAALMLTAAMERRRVDRNRVPAIRPLTDEQIYGSAGRPGYDRRA